MESYSKHTWPPNVSCDLNMEHLNKECKESLSGLGSNHSVEHVGKCIGRLITIVQQFYTVNGIPSQCSHHSNHSRKGDIEKIVKQLTEMSRVFSMQTDRTCTQALP